MSTEKTTSLIGDFLFGYVPGEERVCIKNTAEQIAAFIMANQFKGQVKVVNFLDELEIQTIGQFIDTCQSQHFLKNELLPVLIPMQKGESEVIEFVPYVDQNYTLKHVRGINDDGKYVLVNLEFFDYTEEELANDEVFDTEEELIAKYPDSIGEEYAGWFINSSPYDREEFIEEYVDSECDNDNVKDLLGISDEVVATYMTEEGYDDFKVAVTKKMNAMSVDELNAFAFKYDIYNRVKKSN